MILRKLLLAACFVTIVANAPAQPGRTCPAPVTDPLRKIWEVHEGDWTAKWDPFSAPEVIRADVTRAASFRGAWSKGSETAQGTLRIAVNGSSVEVDRIDASNGRNTCHYRGTLNAQGTGGRGGYTCSYHTGSLEWTFKVLTPSPSMYCDGNDPRIAAVWHEQEGQWRGDWTPTGFPGTFRAHLGKLGSYETAEADMLVTITQDSYQNRNVVRVHRNGNRGTCEYMGTLVGSDGRTPNVDGWNVTGTYQCSWGGGTLPWGARIGQGHP